MLIILFLVSHFNFLFVPCGGLSWLPVSFLQGDHLSEKPGNVREFDSCQGNVRDYTKNQGNVMEKILSGKSCLKVFIVDCVR